MRLSVMEQASLAMLVGFLLNHNNKTHRLANAGCSHAWVGGVASGGGVRRVLTCLSIPHRGIINPVSLILWGFP